MDLHRIDEQVFRIWKRVWNLKWLKPVNQKEEMECFFANDSYEPQFAYERADFSKEEEELERLKEAMKQDSEIANLMKQKIEKLLSWLAMLRTRGTPEFTEHSIEYYGTPSQQLVEKARELMKEEDDFEKRSLTIKEALPVLQQAAKPLGWKVVAKKGLNARADCVIPERTLYLREDARFSEQDIKKLAVHELGVHATRAENGAKKTYKLFLMGTAEYETTEEGLAGFMEEKAGVATKRSMKRKAALVLVVDKALSVGFRKTYAFVQRYFTKESAFHLVMRVKRGLGDTSKPGAYTKDYLYLKGLEQVRKLSPEQRAKLLEARIGIEELRLEI